MMIKTTLVSPAGGWPGRFGRRWVRSQPVPSKEAPSVPAPASARNSLRVSVRALLTTPGEYYVPTGCINRMPLRAEGLARAAAMVEADYLMRDPCPGDQQDIIRVPR